MCQCGTVCGYHCWQTNVGVLNMLTERLAEDQVDLTEPWRHLQTRICPNTVKTDPTQISWAPATVKDSTKCQTQTNTNITPRLLTAKDHRDVTQSPTLQTNSPVGADTWIHSPSASVLSSECPFRLDMLEICPFFCNGWKIKRRDPEL